MAGGLTKSARRVFDILELFRVRQCPLRLKDVVDSLGMPTSSAAALLKTMAQMNYLSFESTSRAYLPTLRLSQLGSWVTAANHEGGPIQEAVRRIGRKVGETILLGTPTDIYVEIVDILRARQPLQYYTTVGTRVLLAHSGLGWPLLSALPDEEIAKIYRRTVRQRKIERGVSSLNRLKSGIAQVRRDALLPVVRHGHARRRRDRHDGADTREPPPAGDRRRRPAGTDREESHEDPGRDPRRKCPADALRQRGRLVFL